MVPVRRWMTLKGRMIMTEKVDLKKELKAFYKPSAKKFSIVTVPPNAVPDGGWGG